GQTADFGADRVRSRRTCRSAEPFARTWAGQADPDFRAALYLQADRSGTGESATRVSELNASRRQPRRASGAYQAVAKNTGLVPEAPANQVPRGSLRVFGRWVGCAARDLALSS